MTVAIIDINDIALGCFHGNQQVAAPGFALLTSDGILTGEPALRRTWLEPQQAFSRFWRNLDLSPLPVSSRFARHHADLAYAHLSQVHTEAGQPASVVFAVPGSFSDDQLGILLGLGNALPFDVLGMVDSATASCSGIGPGFYIHIDVQLHQIVLTEVSVNEHVERGSVAVLKEAGLQSCMDAWIHYIANQYIDQHRFDPLHTADCEQQLHDRLPGWMEKLYEHTEVPIELDTAQGTLRLTLNPDDLLHSTQNQRQILLSGIRKMAGSGARIVCSHRVRQVYGHEFPIIGAGIAEVITVEKDCLVAHCLSNLDVIGNTTSEANGDINFITQLPASNRTAISPELPDTDPGARIATHVLIEGRAYAISDRLVITIGPDGLICGAEPASEDKQLVVVKLDSKVVFETGSENIDSSARLDDLLPGDEIGVGSFKMQLIEVC